MALAPQPMDIALDDYMKEKNIRRPKRGGAATVAGATTSPGRGRGGARRGRSARGGQNRTPTGSATKRPAVAKQPNKVTGRRTISKAGGGGARSGSTRTRNLNSNLRGAMGTRWQHDLFSSPTSGGGSGGGSSRSTSAKALITNLDFGVTDNDIRDLFSEFGSILKHAVHYDKSGRSMGIAEVTFASRSDALRAKAKYNNVPLDGRPMQIAVEGSSTGTGTGAEPGSMKSRIGQRPSRPSVPARPTSRGGRGVGAVAKGGRRSVGGGAPSRGTSRGARGGASPTTRGRGRGGATRGGRGGRGANLTTEQLDADLDAYKNQNGA